ncbi:MAG: helix-turn-helix domain-containing protein [Nanoarchaeota archaeon]
MEILQKLGLSGSEVKVYLALLEIGSSTAGELTKKCGLYRTNIYDALEKLREKGLVSSILKNNKKYYSASKLEKLNVLLDNKKEDLQILEKELNNTLKKLSEKEIKGEGEFDVKIFTGKNGVKNVMEEVLEDKKPFFAFGAEANFEKLFPIYFTNWVKQLFKNKIDVNAIYNEKVRVLREKKKISFANFRYIHGFENPVTTQIFGDKVVIIHWQETPLIIQINNKKIAQSYMNVFNLMWKVAKV